ncbi:acyl-CoA dehydrogenase family protein [Marinobacter sp. 2_MG-2023]|nr:acyl-CoA dehydrogenase family protein [Marinobacter sp. 2_MG-2023]
MRYRYSPELEEFRHEVRCFIREKLPSSLARKTRRYEHLAKEDVQLWHSILAAHGWSASHWPKEYGGPGWSPVERYLFDEECALADAPPLSPFGLALVGPVIYTFGSDSQRQHYLPKIRNGQHWWCQGYSEPDAGSDLVALKTKAVLEGSEYIITGQKTWSTDAHLADYMICLARTRGEGKPQASLSLFIIDMQAEGVTVRPIETIDHGHSVNEVFLDGVRVPASALVGEENQGWTYAKFLLGNERTHNAQVQRSRRDWQLLCDMLKQLRCGAGCLIDEPSFGRAIAELDVLLIALEASVKRVLEDQVRGREPGTEASILKLEGSELQQAITNLAVRALEEVSGPLSFDLITEHIGLEGPCADYAAGVAERHLFRRSVSIYAGANEIQKNIIAKSVLGM